jgi:hypothetical protein
VKDRLGVEKPQRVEKLEDIKKAILSGGDDGDDDKAIQVVTSRVIEIARRYAALIKPDLNHYGAKITRQIGEVFENTNLLSSQQRETLALSMFLSEQIDSIGATNYAGPALLFTGVLEEITRLTIFPNSELRNLLKDKEKTLGNLPRHQFYLNRDIKAEHWNSEFSKRHHYPISEWLADIRGIIPIRNKAAHEAHIPKEDFQKLESLFFGNAYHGVGAFTGLLKAWIKKDY